MSPRRIFDAGFEFDLEGGVILAENLIYCRRILITEVLLCDRKDCPISPKY